MSHRHHLCAALVLLPACVIVLDTHEARACGGCFHEAPPPPPPNIPNPPPNEVDSTVVTEHRMAFALSTTQSVLWDQIRYSGNPKEFAWVLPVQQGTKVELSNDAWLAALDANTATIIEPPPEPYCPPIGGYAGGGSGYGGGYDNGGGYGGGAVSSGLSGEGGSSADTPSLGGGGCACGFGMNGTGFLNELAAMAGGDDASTNGFSGSSSGGGGGASYSGGGSSGIGGGGPPPPPPVTVETQETVGPYEVVILRSSMGEALDAWLIANGFEIPPNIQPILDAYVAQNLDFVAMKLRPGANVNAMRPVRVIEPGADPTLPLRMISAGAGAHVGLTLWVISEGRYQPQNFPNATIDFSQLVYDVGQVRSNYSELRAAALSASVPTDAGMNAQADVGTNAVADAGTDAVPSAPTDAGAGGAIDAQADGGIGGTVAPTDGGGAVPGTTTGYWLTEYAGLVQLRGLASSGLTPGLLDAYAKACIPQTPSNPCDAGTNDAGANESGAGGSGLEAGEAGEATDASDDGAAGDAAQEAGDDAGSDGAPAPVVACTPPAPTVCDDPLVAFTGLHTGSIWVTRLEADLPASALGADLVLEAEPSQSTVTNVHRAVSWVDGNPCTLSSVGALSARIGVGGASPGSSAGAGGKSCELASQRTGDGEGVWASLGVAALTAARWRRRRR
jgi:hypothetical protein